MKSLLAPLTALLLPLLSACVSSEDPQGKGNPNQAQPAGTTAGSGIQAKSPGGDPSKAPVAKGAGTTTKKSKDKMTEPKKLATATFGAGCFWCIEAVLEQVKGISNIRSGYMGGAIDNPTYEMICTGTTGHAEVVQLNYDPDVISYEGVLKWFFKLHDPTTLNRQGHDVGTQYRSVIFYHDDEQKKSAETVKKKIDDAKVFDSAIVTEISKAEKFWVAEEKHQDFYKNNPNYGYCRAVIAPKLDKLGLQK